MQGYEKVGIESCSGEEVAIVGMACVFPKAPDLSTFWHNIISKVDAITDPPQDNLINRVFAPDSHASNRLYCRRGGYLEELPAFYPTEYGIMPVALDGAEPEHFMALQVAHDALLDAGYPDCPLNKRRTEIILGRGTFVNRGYMTAMQHSVVIDQTLRLLQELHPEYSPQDLSKIEESLKAQLPPFSSETAPGLCHNLMAGLIANRLDLQGRNLVLDAACASCLLALEIAIDDLQKNKCDAAIVGGVQISTHAPIHMIFTQLGALSKSDHLRPFDTEADGTMLGEGIGMVVLKRLKEAQREGHRIYAVLKGVGSSSDGKGGGLLAPRLEGEQLAVRRAYEMTDIDPATIGLIEAHGTGIPLGDITEINAMRTVFGSGEDRTTRCALGTVKSMIGHLIPAAGIAGVIKTALALYHKTLPPTLFCEQPNADCAFDDSPFYLNTDTRPWIHGNWEFPRRAGVNAFGFGGINGHVIMEEAVSSGGDSSAPLSCQRESELFVFTAFSRSELLLQCRRLMERLSELKKTDFTLADIAFTLTSQLETQEYKLAIVAGTIEELEKKLAIVVKRLQDVKRRQIKDRSGIYFFEDQLRKHGKIAFLFPGEGSQYINMLMDLCLYFPEVRECFDLLDRAYADHPRNYLPSQFLFPPTKQEREKAEEMIWNMDGAVDAVSTANRALAQLFNLLEIKADAILGHSSGELAAIEAAGGVELKDDEEIIFHIRAGNTIIESLQAVDDIPEANLLAVGGVDRATIDQAVEKSSDFLSVAMENCPHQFVLCGTPESIATAGKNLQKNGAICQHLPFQRAYHTKRFEKALTHLRIFFDGAHFITPRIPLYSCMTAGPMPNSPEEVARYALEQWAKPVRFHETILNMYEDGFKIFLEVGPRANLTGFVNDILKKKPFVAVAANVHHKPGITQLYHAVGLLFAHGVEMNLLPLYRRGCKLIKHLQDEELQDSPQKVGITLSLDLPLLSLQGVDVPKPWLNKQHDEEAVDITIDKPEEKLEENSIDLNEKGLVAATSAERVMGAHFQTMERFLLSQRRIMGAYLESNNATPVTPEEGQPSAVSSPNNRDLEEPSLMVEKTAPIIEEQHSEPDPTNVDECKKSYGREEVKKLLLNIVSDKTGYPEEMLALDQNMEAELGIDSIKRVEILGTMAKELGELEESETDDLSRLESLGEIIDFLVNIDTSAKAKQPYIGLPFIGKIITRNAEMVEVEYLLDLSKDVFLQDHTLGSRVSQVDPNLTGLPVMPFNMSLEIMAETASLLFPGNKLTIMYEVKAHNWIILEKQQLQLTLKAVRDLGTETAKVTLAVSEEEGARQHDHIVIEAEMHFRTRYPEAGGGASFVLKREMDCAVEQKAFYPQAMFHGPAFQTLVAVQRCGEKGIESLLTIPEHPLLDKTTASSLLSWPVLLDGAGQTVGLWAATVLEQNFIVFPVGVDAIHFYTDQVPENALITCRVLPRTQGEGVILSDIDLIGEDGTLLAHMKGVRHKRVNMPEVLHLFRGSRDVLLSSPWSLVEQALPSLNHVSCCRFNGSTLNFKGSDGHVLRAVIAHIILGRKEREAWQALKLPEERKTQWLMGRLCAKEAVRRMLHQKGEPDMWPADIDIAADVNGKPEVVASCFEHLDWKPVLSVSHCRDTAVAFVVDSGQAVSVGIDIEQLRTLDDGFERLAFSGREKELLEQIALEDRDEWVLRFWCGREAVAKAFGTGNVPESGGLDVRSADFGSGVLNLHLPEQVLLEGRKGDQQKEVEVCTLRESEIIAACMVRSKEL